MQFTFTKVDLGSDAERARNNMILKAIAETVKECSMAPRGILYAALMGQWSFNQFTAAMSLLESSGLIKQTAEIATWIGDEAGEIGLFGERVK
jgi:hypothetical protein